MGLVRRFLASGREIKRRLGQWEVISLYHVYYSSFSEGQLFLIFNINLKGINGTEVCVDREEKMQYRT